MRPDEVGLTSVNHPDKDVQPTGQFEIYNASEPMSAVYSPEGAFLGRMRIKRIETLLRTYWNTTSSELCDFPPAIAKLIAEYKEGSKSGIHNVAYKNCYTAPPSALGASTDIFASSFGFNPKYEALLCPIRRRCRVKCPPHMCMHASIIIYYPHMCMHAYIFNHLAGLQQLP